MGYIPYDLLKVSKLACEQAPDGRVWPHLEGLGRAEKKLVESDVAEGGLESL